MRADPIHLWRRGRTAVFVLLGAAIVAVAIGIDWRKPVALPTTSTRETDPLSTELERCRNIANPADVDDACRAAWAAVRQRFFETREVRP